MLHFRLVRRISASRRCTRHGAVDPEQWVRAAQSAGARYIVLVAKHHDGFCLWPTEESDYSVKSSPWKGGKGDLVAAVVVAARKYGMKFGVYLSPWDRHEPRYKDSAACDDYYESQVGDPPWAASAE
jgi:alpha-L-fucosidase